MEATKTKAIVTLSVLLVSSLFLNFYLLNRPTKKIVTTITERDTVITHRVDYDTVWLQNTVYKDRYHYDTLIVENTIYLKDTVNNYFFGEKDYDLSINAMKLENYKLDIHHRDTITLREIQTVKTKERKFSIGVGVGYGYGLKSNSAEPFVGVSITYKLF